LDTSGTALPAAIAGEPSRLITSGLAIANLILRGIEVKMAKMQNEPVASVIEDLYPLAQVAKILRCSRKSVYRLISSGKLNAVRWGRSYKFRREDIQQFLRSSAILRQNRK
jgi:excisionase family DNA binding protein